MAKTPPIKLPLGARKAKLPQFIPPQLATLVKEPPSGERWLHELKFDGYRMLCRIDRGDVQFWSRNRKEWTAKFPDLSKAVKHLHATTAFLDGEIVVVDAQGRSSFQKLQRSMGKAVTAGFVYAAFDLMYLDGLDLTKTPLRLRKSLLETLMIGSGQSLLRYSDHMEGNGDAFFRQACDHGIEGIVSKLADSPYESTRGRNWLKVKCNKAQEFLIVGYTTSSKGMPSFGALVLGIYDKGTLQYAGRVGTGFTFKARADLKKKMDRLSREKSPLSVVPKDPRLRGTHWIDPKLVAEVEFAEWTSDGSIRHPSFQGLREDKKPKDIVRELPSNPRGKLKR